MGYQIWPSGLPPYVANTYVTDRVTPLNHQSIMNGLARDVGSLQHHINTTHLFASGYLYPIASGYFKNIDTNYLYVENLQSRSFALYNVVEPNIAHLSISGNLITATDSAFRGNNIQVSDSFRGTNFSLNVSGLMYNPIFISGGLYDYYLQQNGDYRFLEGLFSKLTICSGNIILDSGHKIILENLNAFAPSGAISESGILWNPSTGHDHKDSKVKTIGITDSDVDYLEDLVIETQEGSIDIVSGVLDAVGYIQELSYDNIGFYELDYAGSGRYSCDIPALSGFVRDLDIGTNQLISYNDRVYATSVTSPSGATNLTDAYIYDTDDFYNWTGTLVSGAYRPNVSGVTTIDSFVINNGVMWFLMNLNVGSGNYCGVREIEHINAGAGIFFNIGAYAHGSSRYGLGLASIENSLMIYGYEYPHIYTSGIPKWDKHCLLWESGPGNESLPSVSSGQDLSYSGVAYNYSYPFIQGMYPGGGYMPTFWLDGSVNIDGTQMEPALQESSNEDMFGMLSTPSDYFSGYFAGFFGNGFSEITAMLSTDISYHNGQRGIYAHRNQDIYGKAQHADLIENYAYSPLLVFGNSTVNVQATSGNIFGGCIPLIMDLDKRLLDGIGGSNKFVKNINADFAPVFLHGARSLMDTTLLFRIPAYAYWNIGSFSIINSNLYANRINNSGRLWTDYSWPEGQHSELINLCPWQPGLLTTPFGGSGQVYYKHTNDTVPVKLNYTSLENDSNGLIIPSGACLDHRNYPTYYEQLAKDGFWSTKTFDWFYNPSSVWRPEAPSGIYPKTYYYMRPKCSLQHNGIVYNILEYNTGFVYTGPNGSEYINDEVLYSDLIKYGNTIYGVGSTILIDQTGAHNYQLVLTMIKRNVSTLVKLPTTLSSKKLTPKFLIHKGLLYIGIGGGRFLVKKPSHTDLCITSNL